MIPTLAKRAYHSLITRKKLPHPEPYVKQCIDSIIEKTQTDVFVDIGANSGQVYALPYARKFKQVLAVEPNPYMVELLNGNLRKRHIHNVIVNQIAISDKEGKVSFFKEEGTTAGASTLEKDRIHVMTDFGMQYSEIQVLTDTLDNVYGMRGYRRLSLLLIDVEGHEFKVLAGAHRTLGWAENVIIELHTPELRQQLHDVLSLAGFNVHWIDKTHIWGFRAQ